MISKNVYKISGIVVIITNLIIFHFFDVQVGITYHQDFRNETAKVEA